MVRYALVLLSQSSLFFTYNFLTVSLEIVWNNYPTTVGDGRISYNDFLAAMLNSADIPVTEPAKNHGLFDGFRRFFDPHHHQHK